MTWLSRILDFVAEALSSSLLSRSAHQAGEALRNAVAPEDLEFARQECADIERAILHAYFHF